MPGQEAPGLDTPTAVSGRQEAFLIRNQPSLDRALIVVTYRSDELHRSHPLRPLLAELGRIGWVTRLELGRLNRQDTRQLVAQIISRGASDDLLAAVYRRSEGNPLFVEALLDEGELGSVLPESLRDLLVASVRRLPEETQEVLRIASAGGERTGHRLLAAVTGLDGAGLARALRPAVAANVLLTDPDSYMFRHALIRDAVHDELLPGERGQLHSRFAEAIGADPALVMPGRAPRSGSTLITSRYLRRRYRPPSWPGRMTGASCWRRLRCGRSIPRWNRSVPRSSWRSAAA